MKLRHQGALILGITLAFQLITAVILISTLINVNTAAAAESTAKRVISTSQDIRILLLTYVRNIAARRFVDVGDLGSVQHNISQKVDAKLALMKSLVAEDKDATKLVDAYGRQISNVNDLAREVTQNYQSQGGVFLARFLNDREYMEEMTLALNKVTEAEQAVIQRFAAVAKELSPESQRQRENVLRVTICAVAINLIVIITVAWLLGRRVLARLNMLMRNIQRFGAGQPLQVVPGNDELAELDHVFRDMSAARQSAEQLRRSLVAMVSHDLRSPLTSIGISLELAMETYAQHLPPKANSGLRKINREIQRLSRMANAFLDLEKIEDGKLELFTTGVALEELVSPAVDAVTGLADSKKVTIDTAYDAATEVRCDVERIIQVLVNLLSNAVKYSPVGSAVKVTCRPLQSAVRFEVYDQGPGVSEEEHSQLFNRFSQLSQDTESKKLGSGLGLYICKVLVEAHAGTIGCDRMTDRGSCFWFILPLADAASSTRSALLPEDLNDSK